MSSELLAISANNLGKCYQLYTRPHDRLKQFLLGGKKQYYREFWALRDVNFEIMPGEVLGVIGRNGSGKSTLLQMVCGTLTPTVGEVSTKGRVAALLELGAGFNPEFSGRENVFLSASILGLSRQEIATRFEDIIDFSGIRDFIDQPVKTYSSGMFVRLAFSVATSIDPDILVIDEALSVGDSEFSRKSFDRIIALKNAGKTILFCSHSMHQIEAICTQTIWLDQGRVALFGKPAHVVTAYNTELMRKTENQNFQNTNDVAAQSSAAFGTARINRIEITANGQSGKQLVVQSNKTDIAIRVEFSSDTSLPSPTIAIGIHTKSGHAVTSAGSLYDGVSFARDSSGRGSGEIMFPGIPLLKGDYTISIFLTCEQMIHIYDYVERCAELIVEQSGLEQGVVTLPHIWRDTLIARK